MLHILLHTSTPTPLVTHSLQSEDSRIQEFKNAQRCHLPRTQLNPTQTTQSLLPLVPQPSPNPTTTQASFSPHTTPLHSTPSHHLTCIHTTTTTTTPQEPPEESSSSTPIASNIIPSFIIPHPPVRLLRCVYEPFPYRTESPAIRFLSESERVYQRYVVLDPVVSFETTLVSFQVVSPFHRHPPSKTSLG